MRIFNSLGSNYDIKYLAMSLVNHFSINGRQKLTNRLGREYKGEVHLFYKAREALYYCIKSLNLSNDDVVAVNGLTCAVVCDAIIKNKVKLEMLDIADDMLNFNLASIKNAVNRGVPIKVVIFQNTLGDTGDIKEISKYCKKNKIVLIEDLAHSNGGKYGDFLILSFGQDKILDSVSGGALIIRNKKYFNLTKNHLFGVRIRLLLSDFIYPFATYIIRNTYKNNLGKITHYLFKKLRLLSQPINGLNSEDIHIMPAWHASMARYSFDNMNADILHRKRIIKIYEELLPNNIKFGKNYLVRYPIITNNRDGLINFLKSYGIYVSDIWYDSPIAPMQFTNEYKKIRFGKNSISVSRKLINLPTHKNVGYNEAREISRLINKWLSIQ